MTGERESLALEVDAATRSITVELDDEVKDKDRIKEKAEKQKAAKAAGKDEDKDLDKETWKYTRPAAEQLVIDGVHRGTALHVILHLEPLPLLITRGFHWINEVPFNR